MLYDQGMAWLPALIIAPFIGSFLGVLIRRLPAGRSVAITRSACEACGRTLAPRELVPIVSFVVQRGRCATCACVIAPMHLAVELAALAIAGVACVVLVDPVALWLGCALGWTLLTLAWIDADHDRLPNVLTMPLILVGFAATWLREPQSLSDHAAAAVGCGVLWALAASTSGLWRRGRGDAHIVAAAGAWTGLGGVLFVIMGGSMGILCRVAVARLRGERVDVRTTMRSLLPGLAIAFWATWLWQQITASG